jgi:type I restriction enzyme S subunit
MSARANASTHVSRDPDVEAPVARLRRFKPYPAYRDSGVEWLGEIPAHWEIKRLKRIAEFRGGGTPEKDNLEYWSGDIPWVSPKDMKVSVVSETEDKITPQAVRESATKFVPAGAVLIVVRSGILVHSIPVALSGREVTLNQDLKALIPKSEISPEYLMYLISGMQRALLAEWKKEGATVESLELDLIAATPIPLPSAIEQRATVAFLDRETARIDGLVVKKERLIELLQERRTALITRAVTKGLDPSVPMKDSGVEWLGEIPAHWEIKRLWHLTPSDRRIMYGIVLPGPNVDDGVPIVKGGDVSPDRLRLDRLNRTTREIESGYVRSRLRSDDLVYAIRGSIGEVAMVPPAIAGANLTQDAARISYTSATHGPWLLYALKSTAVFAQLEAGALGATIRGINIRDLKRASIAVPPRDEQHTIATFLGRETAQIDALLGRVRDAIASLKEFSTALISAAVTGKIDVREEVT